MIQCSLSLACYDYVAQVAGQIHLPQMICFLFHYHKILCTFSLNLLKSWNTPTATALAMSSIPDGWTEDEGEVVLLEGMHAENPNLGANLSLKQKEEAQKRIHFIRRFLAQSPV